MVNNLKLLGTQDENKLESVAYELRNCLKIMDTKPLPSLLTADDVIRRECDFPQQLLQFIQNLTLGSNISSDDFRQHSQK